MARPQPARGLLVKAEHTAFSNIHVGDSEALKEG